MTGRESAIDLAKRHLVDSIYSSVCVEGLGITFPQTQQILSNIPVSGVKPNDILFVLNMREAWRFVLETLDEPINMMYVRELNKICGNGLIYGCGVLRESIVTITGTTYIPPIPQHGDVVAKLEELSGLCGIDKGISLFEYLSKSQLFIDGNKRVAQLLANKSLIADGLGILKIPDISVSEFGEALIDYYENESASLGNYLYRKCFLEAVAAETLEYKGLTFTIKEVVSSLPGFVRERYSSDLECAQDNIEMYYNSML